MSNFQELFENNDSSLAGVVTFLAFLMMLVIPGLPLFMIIMRDSPTKNAIRNPLPKMAERSPPKSKSIEALHEPLAELEQALSGMANAGDYRTPNAEAALLRLKETYQRLSRE